MIINQKGEITGVIDFNIAGDEVLVSDLIIEGIFICYVMDLEESLNDENRGPLFDLLIEAYQNTRKLTELEISVMNDLYSIVYPFLWFKIGFLKELIKSNDVKKINLFLEELRNILNDNYFGPL